MVAELTASERKRVAHARQLASRFRDYLERNPDAADVMASAEALLGAGDKMQEILEFYATASDREILQRIKKNWKDASPPGNF